ncbi:MAG TPA: hypothetical protein VII13_14405 [Vicinamibacteria bacterium]|jgi:hypothetical protein
MPVRATRQLGFQVLAVWLILSGVLGVTGLAVPGLGLLIALLAVAAGVLILIGR